MNGDIMSHYLPQNAADMHHPQYGTIANVPDTHAHCLFGVSVRTYGTHSENTLWHQRYCRNTSTVIKFTFILQGMHSPMSVLIHSTLLLFTILCISNNGGLSWSWHVFHLLPAHLRPMDPIHHHCLQYTYSTTDSTHLPKNCSRLISINSKKLNHQPLVLFGQINQPVSPF